MVSVRAQITGANGSMQKSLSEQFSELARDDAVDELQAACLVTQTLDPNFDSCNLHRQMNTLIENCDNAAAPWRYLQSIGFAGNEDDYSSVENSRMDLVVLHKRGIPITLGVVLLHVARQLGHTSHGINFPGHFLVRVDATLVDPFHMTTTSEAECLRDSDVALKDAFAITSAKAVALRMLNNLKFNFARRGKWDLALDILDYQIAIEPGEPQLHLERGEFWVSLGAVGVARQCFEQAIALAQPQAPKTAALARVRLSALADHKEVLH